MANPLISYGWGSGGFPGGMNSTALPNAGAGLARSYPSWLNQYGYQGSMADNAPKTFADPGVDPYSLLPRHDVATAANPDVAPQMAGAAGVGNDRAGPELNAEGGPLGNFAGTAMDTNIGRGDPTGAPGPDLAGTGGQGSSTGGPLGFARGGVVTRNRLTGPDPDGPDDGYVPLKIGEGVLTDAALKHYGKGIVARLNKLQVDKNRLTGK